MRICLFILLPFLLFAQEADERSVRLLQDRRSSESADYLPYLRSENSRERELALLAMANVQDTSFTRTAAALLNDPEIRVRSMAAFAVGMTAAPGAAVPLFRRLAVERDERCVAALFNAIGLCGTAEDLKKLIVQSEDYPVEWNADLAVSVYRFANRRIKDAAATKHMVTLLDDNRSIVNASYALMRINDTTILRKNRDRMLRLLNNTSPLVRMWGSTILGAMDDSLSTRKLLSAARSDKDWRVRVNALRALRNNRSASMLKLAADSNVHVAAEAVSAYATLTVSDQTFRDSAAVLRMLRASGILPQAKDALRKVAASKMGERALPYIREWKGDSPFSSAQRIAALGAAGTAAAVPLVKEALAPQESSVVTMAAIEAYHALARTGSEAMQTDLLSAAVHQFKRKNAGISYTAAVVFQDTLLSRSVRERFLPALIIAYRSMTVPADLEPMVELLNVFSDIGDSSVLPLVEPAITANDRVIAQAARRAYTAITGSDELPEQTAAAAEYQPFFRMDDLALLDRYTSAVITTSKGTFTVRFDKEGAPLTVLNFILLAEKKFYDGLSFHRVVSNFVIQGGDPLGNGSGGPEHSIRTEVHPSSVYRTGGVGMASAGKDTEGSQWFVTHCPTPHLDYRYSIFGYTQDRAVVDRISIGDVIRTVVLQ